MRILTTIIFFAALVYYLVHYSVRFVRFLKKKFGARAMNASGNAIRLTIPDEVQAIVFPGGEDEINDEADKLYLLLEKRHPKELIKQVLTDSSLYFAWSEDKSEGKLMDYIQELSQGRISAVEAKLIHDFVYSRALRVQFYGDEELDEAYFNEFINDIDELTGCDADEIPDGSGAFGLEPTNPIPVKGIISNEYYLNRLRTYDGSRIRWERTGSGVPSGFDSPVDRYQIFDLDGNEIAQLYLSPYHKRVSNQAPEGFTLVTKAELAAANTNADRFSESVPKYPEADDPDEDYPENSYPETDDREPAASIHYTTDPDGNEEITVVDLRLITASSALLAASASLLIPDVSQAESQLQTAVSSLDDFPGPEDANTIQLLRMASGLAEQFRDLPTAERLTERALKAQQRQKKAHPERLSDLQYELGHLLSIP